MFTTFVDQEQGNQSSVKYRICLRVAKPRVIEVMTNASGDERAELPVGEVGLHLGPARMDEDVHHLGDTKAMAEVVEGIVPVPRFYGGL